jgi:hypothetical protein
MAKKKKKRGRKKGKKKRGRKDKAPLFLQNRDNMKDFAKSNLDVSMWLFSAREMFQKRVKRDLYLKEIGNNVRMACKGNGESEEDIALKVNRAIEKAMEELSDIEGSEEECSSEDGDDDEFSKHGMYMKPMKQKSINLPRLYTSLRNKTSTVRNNKSVSDLVRENKHYTKGSYKGTNKRLSQSYSDPNVMPYPNGFRNDYHITASLSDAFHASLIKVEGGIANTEAPNEGKKRNFIRQKKNVSSLIIGVKGHDVLGGGFTIERPTIGLGLYRSSSNYKTRNRKGEDPVKTSILGPRPTCKSHLTELKRYEEDRKYSSSYNARESSKILVEGIDYDTDDTLASWLDSDEEIEYDRTVEKLFAPKAEETKDQEEGKAKSQGEMTGDEKQEEELCSALPVPPLRPKTPVPVTYPCINLSWNGISDDIGSEVASCLSVVATAGIGKTESGAFKQQEESSKTLLSSYALDLSHNKIKLGLIDLAEKVSLRRLRHLNIASNNLKTDGIIAFARSFRIKRHEPPSLLEYLNLSENKITDRAMCVLGRYLSRYAIMLKNLVLDHNQISIQGATAVGSILSSRSIQNLTALSIRSNYIQQDGAAALGSALAKNKHLKYLDVSFNALGNCEGRRSAHAWSRALRKHKKLFHIDFSYNRFDTEDCKIIKEGLTKNQILMGIHFEGNSGGHINPRGHLIVGKNQHFKSENLIKAQISSIKDSNLNLKDKHSYASVSQSEIYGQARQANAWKAKSSCWVCGGWRPHKFTFNANAVTPGVTTSSLGEPITDEILTNLNELWRNHLKVYHNDLLTEAEGAYQNDKEKELSRIRTFRHDGMLSKSAYKKLLNDTEIKLSGLKDGALSADWVSAKESSTSGRCNISDYIKAYSRGHYISGPKNSTSNAIKNVVLVVDFDSPVLMEINKATKTHHITLMCPPGRVRYHFLIKNRPVYACDQEVCLPNDKDPNFNAYPVEGGKSESEIISERDPKDQLEAKYPKKDVLAVRNVVGILPFEGKREYPKSAANTLKSESQCIPRSKRPKLKLAPKKANPWKKITSVFAAFRDESDSLLSKAYLNDWKMAVKKIKKFVKDPAEIEALKDIFEEHWFLIKNIFKAYAVYNGTEPFYLGSNTFTEFCNECKIVDGGVTVGLQDIDTIFIATNYTSEKIKNSLNNPERCIVRFQFLESLVRLAMVKYGGNSRNAGSAGLPPSDSVEKMIRSDLAPYSDQIKNLEFRHNMLYGSIPINDLYKEHYDELERVYKLYAASIDLPLPGQKKVMSVREFQAVVDGLKLGKVYGLTERETLRIFLSSQELQICEIRKTNHRVLKFVEYLEAVSRLAYYVGTKKHERKIASQKEAAAKEATEKKKSSKPSKKKKKRKTKMSAMERLKAAANATKEKVIEEKNKDAPAVANLFGGMVNTAVDARSQLYQYLQDFLATFVGLGKVSQNEDENSTGANMDRQSDAGNDSRPNSPRSDSLMREDPLSPLSSVGSPQGF